MIHRNAVLFSGSLALALSGLVCETRADEPPPLMRESAWADRTAEILLREDFSHRRTAELEISSGEPEVVHFAGRVEDAGHDGGPAYMVDFELPVGKGQEFHFPVPETDSTGIHYRFLLKVDVDPELILVPRSECLQRKALRRSVSEYHVQAVAVVRKSEIGRPM